MQEQHWVSESMMGKNIDITTFKPTKKELDKPRYEYFESDIYFKKAIVLKSCGKENPVMCLECQETSSNNKSKCKKDVLRINEEVNAIIKLSKIDNIVNLVDYGISQGRYFIILEKYKSLDFNSFYATLKLTEIIDVFVPLFNTVYEMVNMGIIHRDLKHDNFLVRDKKLHITDFGISFDMSIKNRKNITIDGEPLSNGLTPHDFITSEENHKIIESEEHSFKIDVINLIRCLFEAISYIEYNGGNYSSFTLYDIFNQIKNRHEHANDTQIYKLSKLIYDCGYYNGNSMDEKLQYIENGAMIASTLEALNYVSPNNIFSCVTINEPFHLSAKTVIDICKIYNTKFGDIKIIANRREIEISQMSNSGQSKIIIEELTHQYGEMPDSISSINNTIICEIITFEIYHENNLYIIIINGINRYGGVSIELNFNAKNFEKIKSEYDNNISKNLM